MKLTIPQAVILSRVGKTKFYEYINKGILHVCIEGNDKIIYLAELKRVFGSIVLIPQYLKNYSYEAHWCSPIRDIIKNIQSESREAMLADETE